MESFQGIDSHVSFPSWLKATAVLFVCIFIPAHWHYSGLTNFLWLSDIGLFGTVLALLLGSRLLASLMLLATLSPDGVGWDVDFLVACLTGWHPLNATVYIRPACPALIRGFRSFRSGAACWCGWSTGGIRPAGARGASLLTSVLLVLTYLITHPERNISGSGPGQRNRSCPMALSVGDDLGSPVLFYLPVHWLLRKLNGTIGRLQLVGMQRG